MVIDPRCFTVRPPVVAGTTHHRCAVPISRIGLPAAAELFEPAVDITRPVPLLRGLWARPLTLLRRSARITIRHSSAVRLPNRRTGDLVFLHGTGLAAVSLLAKPLGAQQTLCPFYLSSRMIGPTPDLRENPLQNL